MIATPPGPPVHTDGETISLLRARLEQTEAKLAAAEKRCAELEKAIHSYCRSICDRIGSFTYVAVGNLSGDAMIRLMNDLQAAALAAPGADGRCAELEKQIAELKPLAAPVWPTPRPERGQAPGETGTI